MKAVKHVANDLVKRVPDEEARRLVDTRLWNYCPKRLPRQEPPEPKPNEATAEEIARFLKLVQDGYTEDMAIEIIALARRTRGA